MGRATWNKSCPPWPEPAHHGWAITGMGPRTFHWVRTWIQSSHAALRGLSWHMTTGQMCADELAPSGLADAQAVVKEAAALLAPIAQGSNAAAAAIRTHLPAVADQMSPPEEPLEADPSR